MVDAVDGPQPGQDEVRLHPIDLNPEINSNASPFDQYSQVTLPFFADIIQSKEARKALAGGGRVSLTLREPGDNEARLKIGRFVEPSFEDVPTLNGTTGETIKANDEIIVVLPDSPIDRINLQYEFFSATGELNPKRTKPEVIDGTANDIRHIPNIFTNASRTQGAIVMINEIPIAVSNGEKWIPANKPSSGSPTPPVS